MVLYLLVFTDEPLVKIGVTGDPFQRWTQLDDRRFDFERSWAVSGENPSLIRAIERDLKATFRRYRRRPRIELSSGNTEVFDAAILREALTRIGSLHRSPELSIQLGLSAGSAETHGPFRNRGEMVTVAFRWPVSLAQQVKDECHRRKMAGIKPYTLNEVTAWAMEEYLESQANPIS